MALIKCNECGQTISDKAEACPHCGAPVSPRDDVAVNEPAKCSECGAQLPDGATECPECGCPVDGVGPEGSLKQTNAPSVEIPEPTPLPKSKKKGCRLMLGFALLAWVVIFVSVAIISTPTKEERAAAEAAKAQREAKLEAERKEREKPTRLKAVKSVEEARELIGGTVWHYTKNTSDSDDQFGFWFKVAFHADGTYTHYRAKPSDGVWTKDKEGTYEIAEGRYDNTGEKYIAVKWQGGGAYGLPCKFALTLDNFQVAVSTFAPDYRGLLESKIYYGQMTYGDYEWD